MVYSRPPTFGSHLLIGMSWLLKFSSGILSVFVRYATNLLLYLLTGIFEHFKICPGKNELQRLLLSSEELSPRTILQVKSFFLRRSGSAEIASLLYRSSPFPPEEFVRVVQRVFFLSDEYARPLTRCSLYLRQTNHAIEIVLRHKNEFYDAGNPRHEEKLLLLWSLTNSYPLTNRVSDQWKTLGFQGTDPATDFRAMGILGLENLIYLAKNESELVREIIALDKDEINGYPLAITSISVSMLCWKLLQQRLCDHYFCLTPPETDSEDFYLNKFCDIYLSVFRSFHALWMRTEKENLLDFPRIFGMLEDDLLDESAEDILS